MAAALFVTSGGCSVVVDGLGAVSGTVSVEQEQALTLARFSYFFLFFVFVSACFFLPSLSLLISLCLREDS